jgi:REP element-mobilizing transposase RayT
VCIFGDIVDGAICLNDTGRIVAEVWQWLATQYDYVMSDAWVIMPNHLHGIMVITHPSGDADQARGGSRTAPTRRKSVGRLVGHSKRCPPNASTNNAVRRARWSGSDYYEHIIRGVALLVWIRRYIATNPNPSCWSMDRENRSY